MITLKFKCYSEKNRDFDEVYYREKRFRGCNKGEPMIVAGYSAEDSERNLRTIVEAFEFNPKAKIETLTKSSAVIVLED